MASAMDGIASLQGATLKVEVQSSSPNLQPLLKKTKKHPKGRIQLDENGEVVGPKNQIVEVVEKPIYITDDRGQRIVIGTRNINVNGGHVLAFHPLTGKQDSVWRIQLAGPKKFHELMEKQHIVHTVKKRPNEKVAPDLEEGEATEYMMYLVYLREVGKKIAEDIDFYNWVEANGVFVEDGEVKMKKAKKVKEVVEEDEEEVAEEKPKKRGRKPKTE